METSSAIQKAAPARQRSRAKSAERWNQILEVATKLFREQGFAATSMQDVSEAVGLLKGSLYYYVKSKEDLLVEILKDLHESCKMVARNIDHDSAHPLEELKKHLKAVAIYSGTHPDRIAIFFRDFQFVPEEQQHEIANERDINTLAAVRLIESAIKKGHVTKSIHARTAANAMLWAASSTYEWYNADDPLSLEKIAEQTASILTLGLKAANRRPKPS